MVVARHWQCACLAPTRRWVPCTQAPAGQYKGVGVPGVARGCVELATFGPWILRKVVCHARLGHTRRLQVKPHTVTYGNLELGDMTCRHKQNWIYLKSDNDSK